MIFTRIEPFPQETFYVLSDEDADLSKIANNPVCFSPVSYRQELVEAGDIPAHAKVVIVEKSHGRIRRINIETAMQISTGGQIEAINEISAAVDMLKAAMQRNGLSAPVCIELQDIGQISKLASLFRGRPGISFLARAAASVFAAKAEFMINGITFTWRKNKAPASGDNRRGSFLA